MMSRGKPRGERRTGKVARLREPSHSTRRSLRYDVVFPALSGLTAGPGHSVGESGEVLAPICSRSRSDSVGAAVAPASTSKKTTSVGQFSLRRSEESPRESDAASLDNLGKKLKQKITWADHKGGSLSSCCPLDVDGAPPSSFGFSSHPLPSSLGMEECSSGHRTFKGPVLNGKTSLNSSYKDVLLTLSSHPACSTSLPKIKRRSPPPPTLRSLTSPDILIISVGASGAWHLTISSESVGTGLGVRGASNLDISLVAVVRGAVFVTLQCRGHCTSALRP